MYLWLPITGILFEPLVCLSVQQLKAKKNKLLEVNQIGVRAHYKCISCPFCSRIPKVVFIKVWLRTDDPQKQVGVPPQGCISGIPEAGLSKWLYLMLNCSAVQTGWFSAFFVPVSDFISF